MSADGITESRGGLWSSLASLFASSSTLVCCATLSNNKKPTQNEKVAILAFDKAVEQCRELGKEWRIKNVPSTVNSMVDSAFSSLKLLLAELYAGRTTYGDFAKNRQELINKLGTQITVEMQRLQQIFAAENERKTREP